MKKVIEVEIVETECKCDDLKNPGGIIEVEIVEPKEEVCKYCLCR